METAKSVGRKVGILLLLQLAAGLMLPFILIGPLNARSPEFLTNAFGNAFQIRAAVIIAFIGAALTLSIGITAIKGFHHYSIPAALCFLAMCVISFALDGVHNATVLSMLSVSEEFVSTGVYDPAHAAVGTAVAAMRRSAHIAQLVAIGGWIFIFYLWLLRFKLVPRAIAALGLVGIASQFAGVTLMMLLGFPVIGWMAMPMLPIQITTAIWLIVKGFPEKPEESGEENDD